MEDIEFEIDEPEVKEAPRVSLPPPAKKKDPFIDACIKYRADLEMAARQCIRIRGPRAVKAQGAELLWLERLEQWLEAGK